jgi:hypothetical protein
MTEHEDTKRHKRGIWYLSKEHNCDEEARKTEREIENRRSSFMNLPENQLFYYGSLKKEESKPYEVKSSKVVKRKL